MAISLDYMGKLVIVMIVVAVSVGIITQFRGQIDDDIGGLGENGNEKGLEIVEVSGSSAETKLSDLIRLCYQRSLERGYESFQCYLARKKSGDFSVDSSSIWDSLEDDVNESTTFEENTFDRDSLVIDYDVKSGKVVVDQ
jgi:hypothetical protein